MEQELLSHFRKDGSGRWVCKFAIRLSSSNGATLSFVSGQTVFAGDHRYKGRDLAAELNRIAAANDPLFHELETASYVPNGTLPRSSRF
jgi:hypothetical protein